MVSDSWPLVGTQDSRGLIQCNHRPFMVKACGNSSAEAEVFNLLICETLAFCLTEKAQVVMMIRCRVLRE